MTFAATVTGSSPTGTVQFRDGATNLGGPVTLSGGSATFATSALTQGSHSMTAVYSGDAGNATSTSSILTQTVNAAAPPPPPPPPPGQPIPALSAGSLIALALLLAQVALAAHRRRR